MANPTLSDDEFLAAVRAHGGVNVAARELGLDRRTVQRRLRRLRERGYSPEHGMHHPVADGYKASRISTMRDGSGEIRAQWVIATPDDERREILIREAVIAATEDLPKLPPREAAEFHLPRLMACYPIGDAHIGMRSWHEETGQDWDLARAELVQCGAMDALVELAPPAEQAVIVNLGDWFHYDNMEGITTRAKHVLDVDGRYAKMIRVGVKVMRQAIESALRRHRFVRVINVIGNHDDTGAVWLSVGLNELYANEPRVTVETSPAMFSYFEHGRVLVGCHHGHLCKPAQLPGVMAADQPEAWGRTKHRYWWLGHVHHQSVKEFPGVTVESFNTLAAADAYAAGHGYRSRQNMKCIVLHEEHGEVARHTVTPDMLA